MEMISPEHIIGFHEETKKGDAYGGYNKEDKIIYVHGIHGQGAVKGLMQRLANRFKTRKFCFTPLINSNVENSIRGTIKEIPPEDEGNPYGETIRCLYAEYEGDCAF